VIGNLTVDPTNPYVDSYAPGGARVVVNVSSKRDDFRLDDARVVEGPFESTFDRDEAAHVYAVQVRLVPSQVPPGQRGSVGKLRLISNDPAEPQKDVPLFALGRVF
jgi:hypothetical protein